jgi:hypothetical protein
MVFLIHELWIESDHEQTFCLAGPMGADARGALSSTARKIWTVRAESYFEAMTQYYAYMGWGEYLTEHPTDYHVYPEEWRSVQMSQVRATPADVQWLLNDLCTSGGYCGAVRDTERFVELAKEGAEIFADAVLTAEGLDPQIDTEQRRSVRDFVAERFELWAVRD